MTTFGADRVAKDTQEEDAKLGPRGGCSTRRLSRLLKERVLPDTNAAADDLGMLQSCDERASGGQLT